ncbi:MAG TPA: hypothetical protein VMZ29_09885 [Candidatus Bathyarchaeia archaeon]|nr:hypothetical protein [Candidatus Bathyarchaeia archaeon]
MRSLGSWYEDGKLTYEQILGDNVESGLTFTYEQGSDNHEIVSFVEGDYTAIDYFINLLAGESATLPITS